MMAVLSHVNARARGRPVALPLLPLASLYASTPSPVVRSFALVYLEMAFEAGRGDEGDRARALPALLSGCAARAAGGRDTAFRLAASALVKQASQPAPSPPAEAGAFLGAAADAAAFLSFAAALLIYQPPATPREATCCGGAHGGVAGGAAGAPAADAPPPRAPPRALPDGRLLPGGLSPAAVTAVEGRTGPPPRPTLAALKAGVLDFVASPSFDAALGAPAAAAAAAPLRALAYVAAAADADDGVSRRGDDLVRGRVVPDASRGPSAAADVLEDPATASSLLRLVLGDPESVPEPDRAAPAAPGLAARALGLLARSRAAAAPPCFDAAAAAIGATVFAPASARPPPAVAAAGAEFCAWTLRHAPATALAPRAATLLAALLAAVDGGDPVTGPASGPAAAARAAAYQSVAALARRAPAALAADPGAAARLFSALAGELAGVRAGAQEAVSAAAAAYVGLDPSSDAATALASLLLDAVASPHEAVRVCAATWAARLFPRSHLPSRWVCVLAAGDASLAVRDAAAPGLSPDADDRRGAPLPAAPAATAQQPEAKKRRVEGEGDAAGDAPAAAPDAAPPSVADLVAYAQTRVPGLTAAPPVAGVGAAAAPSSGGQPLAAPAFAALVRFAAACRAEEGASTAPPPAYVAMLEAALGPACPGALRAEALAALLADARAPGPAPRADLLARELGHPDATARDAAAKLLGAATDKEGAAAVSVASLTAALAGAAAAVGARAPRFEDRDGAAAALGYILARPGPRTDAGTTAAALARLAAAAGGDDAALAGTAAAALGHAMLGGPLATDADAEVALAALEGALSHKAATGVRAGVAGRAAVALGHAAAGDPARAASRAATALLALASHRPPPNDSLSASAGEGLAWAFGGFAAGAAADALTTASSGLVRRSAAAPTAAPPVEAAPPAPATAAAREAILDALLLAPDALVTASSAGARCAGVAWLTALLTTCPVAAPLRTPARLASAQAALLAALSDDGASADAPRGLVAAYGLADASTKADLLAGLTGALAGGAPAARAVKVDGDTKLFEEGALGAAPGGGGLSTWREISSLAADAGDAGLTYRFMALVSASRDARASAGAAVGLASLVDAVGGDRGALVKRLLPRAFRGAHGDPSPAVRDAMGSILAALAGGGDERELLASDPSLAPAVLDALIDDATSRTWRAREGGARAAASLLSLGPASVREGPALARMLAVALRCVDDVKPSVRDAGGVLLRAVRGAALRACEPPPGATRGAAPGAAAAAPRPEAAGVLAALLPPLLEALPSPVDAVRGFALDALAALSGAAPAATLRPLLPALVPACLEALSGLEDASINYVEQHVRALGLDGAGLEEARLAASRASKPAIVLDAALKACDDAEAVASVVPPLASALKRGVGAATRAGAARFAGALAARASREALAPHAGVLLPALLAGGKGGAAPLKRAYAVAAAAVAARAPQAAVVAHVNALVKLAASDSPADRETAGLAAAALLRSAPDSVTEAASPLIPVAALARRDPDEGVATAWSAVWDETAGMAAALRAHGAAVVAGVVAGLAAPQHATRRAAARAAADVAPFAVGVLPGEAVETLLSALAGATPGRHFEGKEDLLAATGALLKDAAGARSAAAVAAGAALAAAAARRTPSFAGAALRALATAAPKLDAAAATAGLTTASAGLAAAAAARDKKAAGGEGEGGSDAADDAPRPPPVADACLAVEKLAPVVVNIDLADAAAGVTASLASGAPWSDRAAAAAAAAVLARTAPSPHPAWMLALVDALTTAASADAKVVALREKAVDGLAAAARAARGERAGDAAAAALAALAAKDGSEAIKARAAAALADAGR